MLRAAGGEQGISTFVHAHFTRDKVAATESFPKFHVERRDDVSADKIGKKSTSTEDHVSSDECHPSYEIANSSTWLEIMCADGSQGWQWREDRECKGLHHVFFQALEDVSVYFCHVSGKTLGLSDDSMYTIKVFKGSLSILSFSTQEDCEVMQKNGLHVWYGGNPEEMSIKPCGSSGELEGILKQRACCLHEASEHEYVYDRRIESSGSRMNFTWRACLFECQQDRDTSSLDRSSLVQRSFVETLDDITDRITDGMSGAYLRFLPEDVWEAYQGLEQAEETLAMIQSISLGQRAADTGEITHDFQYAFHAMGAAAIFDDDRLMRFLCFVRQRGPSLFIGPPDVQLYIKHLLVGPGCTFLPIQRGDVINSQTLADIHQEAMRVLMLKSKDSGSELRAQVVVIHAGSATPVLQKRILSSSQAAQLKVFSIDLSEMVQTLGFDNLDLDTSGAGFSSSSSSLVQETGIKSQDLLNQLSIATKTRRKIRFLVTTALVTGEDDRWSRQELYRGTFKALARLGYPDPLIVEAVHGGESRSFLEGYGHVVYTDLNDFENQGNNEGRSMLLALQTWDVKDDVMVIKLTGRYSPADRRLVQVSMNDGLMFTGCFAMRKGLLQEALSAMDWNQYEVHRLRQICEPDDWLLERTVSFEACKVNPVAS
ncbi:hypothetical protein GUITHDRAFT_138969 [Guillardia theta CCMP2712]|uniref:Uncharacterized protein n=1 Tax=Guillardia theta (strain CCMP2712) TaxID=905079 RepID=L1JA28_GUITC|nr:hypothetical protein GUITHDRAFT_138969 [Guillardia theta CCMP2712]EKX45393.1 hypothetical protein GUITHDRAFT_138969 [Guillardia theta CCMP2712]|eukprot:XP_005832373.1 hypothetical protein GUITHDRAFT_138969 [Guillardia theta CCMP2712]